MAIENSLMETAKGYLERKAAQAILNKHDVKGFLGIDLKEFSAEHLIMIIHVLNDEKEQQLERIKSIVL